MACSNRFFPLFVFRSRAVYGTGYHRRSRFFKYVEHSVSKFYCQKIVKNVHTFKLNTCFADTKELSIVNKILKLVLEKGVKVLDICFNGNTENIQSYRLPIGPSSTVSSLTSLKMPTEYMLIPLSFTDDDVTALKYLKVLHFDSVLLDPHVIELFTVSCHLLEELTVEFCSGFKKFHVYGCLNKLCFLGNHGVKEIDIKAPNLREFHLFVTHEEGKGAPPSIDFGSYKQLRTLHLAGSPFLTSKGLSDFISNFPFLENLSVCLGNRRESLEVSSPSLRNLLLYTNCELEDININTPNLILFILSNYAYNHLGRDSNELNKSIFGASKTRMECHIYQVDTLWFHNLWRFLRKSNRFNFLKLILPTRITLVDFEQLKATQLQPYELEHVELELETIKDISFVEAVVDVVLLFFRPLSLSLVSKFYSIRIKERQRVVKHIHDKLLLQQEHQGHTTIRSNVESRSNSMLTKYRDHQLRERITFIKEVVPEEENN